MFLCNLQLCLQVLQIPLILLFLHQFSLSTSVVFILSFLDCNGDALFIFTNSKYVKTFSFSFFSLVSAFTWLSKASYYFLWRNKDFVHFLSMVSQILAFCFESCNSSFYNFNHVVLPLSYSISSYSFLMSTSIFYSTFALFFF